MEPDETEARLLSELERTECVSGEDEGECEAARLVLAMEAKSMAARSGGEVSQLQASGAADLAERTKTTYSRPSGTACGRQGPRFAPSR